ncbi:MAG TPA: hypothetical protein VGB59_07550 [Allosphingosinicella sp.]
MILATPPPKRPTGSTGVLMILVLLLLVAALGFWAFSENSPAAPTPTATGTPAIQPAG